MRVFYFYAVDLYSKSQLPYQDILDGSYIYYPESDVWMLKDIGTLQINKEDVPTYLRAPVLLYL